MNPTYHSDLFGPRSFPFVDPLIRIKIGNNILRLIEVFHDKSQTSTELAEMWEEREQLYRLTHQLSGEVDRFYHAARSLASENEQLKKELEALKKSIEWDK